MLMRASDRTSVSITCVKGIDLHRRKKPRLGRQCRIFQDDYKDSAEHEQAEEHGSENLF